MSSTRSPARGSMSAFATSRRWPRRSSTRAASASISATTRCWRATSAGAAPTQSLLAAVTDGLNRLFSNTIPPVKLARDLGLAAVDRMPPLKRLLMRHAMGTLGDRPQIGAGSPAVVSSTTLYALAVANPLAQLMLMMWVLARHRGMGPVLVINLLFAAMELFFVASQLPQELSYAPSGGSTDWFDYKMTIWSSFEFATLVASMFAWSGFLIARMRLDRLRREFCAERRGDALHLQIRHQMLRDTYEREPGAMTSDTEQFDVAYLLLSGAATARGAPRFCAGWSGSASRPSSRCRRRTRGGRSHRASWRKSLGCGS